MLTVSVIVLPSADTVGVPIGVTSPAGPPKLTVAPGREPASAERERHHLDAAGIRRDAARNDGTLESTGVVTVNAIPLLTTPPTATVTLPVVACDGTTTVREVVVAWVTVAATRVPPAPVNVTALFAAVELNPEPAITTLPPSGPAPSA